MKNMSRLLALVGVVTLSWFATERPVYAYPVNCSTVYGTCSSGDHTKCIYTDEGAGCYWLYQCSCYAGQWGCGSPIGGTC